MFAQRLSGQKIDFQSAFNTLAVIGFQTACRNQGFTPNVVCRTGQWNLVADMVAHNMGIALLPEYYARKINPDVFAAIPLVEPEIRWQLTMAWKKHQRPTPALRAWLDVVREAFGRRNK